jgi:hypothetical protein
MVVRAVLTGVMLAIGVVTDAPILNDASFAQWRDFIRPAREETQWKEIPWRTAFWDGVTEGQAKDKPILVWAMNGHPLACV